MNKLKYNTKNEICNGSSFVIPKETSTFFFKEKEEINHLIFPEEYFETTWFIQKDCNFFLHGISKISHVHGKLEIHVESQVNVRFHLGLESLDESELSIKIIVEKNDNNVECLLRIIGEKESHTRITTSGILKRNTKRNQFVEDVKYLNEEESTIECLPELIVDSDEVEASHKNSIGKIREDDLFYFESKGIPKEKARQIIRMCFLKSMEK